MLPFLGLQRVRHSLVTEQQQSTTGCFHTCGSEAWGSGGVTWPCWVTWEFGSTEQIIKF